MRKHWLRVVQAVVALLLVFFLVRSFRKNLGALNAQAIEWDVHWNYIVASLAVTWAMYAVLIWGWRTVLTGWGESIRPLAGARIWTISGLISNIPGMVWSIAGMAVMAQREGVSGAAATGSAVIMQLVSLATGAALAILFAGSTLLNGILGGFGTVASIAIAVIALAAAAALTSPVLAARFGAMIKRPGAIRPVAPGALGSSVVANAIAWAGYGLALTLLAQGTLHNVTIPWVVATGVFAASYITGYLSFLPGGIGAREAALVFLLTPSIGLLPATALAAVSRIATTINQVGAAVPFLLLRSQPRVIS